MAVHGDQQRPEALDAEAPQTLRVEIVQVHVLDLFDPGGFQGRCAADDREIDAAQLTLRAPEALARKNITLRTGCLLYTSDAADE